MRATFLLEHLLGKLSFLNLAISPRAQLPALSSFLIEAEKGKIKITATDLETGVLVSIPAGVDEEGKALLPAKPFSELLTSLYEEKATIEKKGGKTTISTKSSRSTMLSTDETEFPKIFDDRGEKAAVFSPQNTKEALSSVVFASSQDPSRPAFSAAYLKQEKQGLLVVATDSHRLSKNVIAGQVFSKKVSAPILVSARTIRALVVGGKDEETEFYVSKKNNQAVFVLGEDILVGRLVDAEYPDFEKIIPSDFSTRAEFNPKEMQGALKTTSIFARDNANIIRLSVGKDKITVFAKSQNLGENSVEIPAKTKGEENEIAFNNRYVAELLQNTIAETMVFEMTGPLNPGVFKIAGNENFIHLIMPIRVKEEEI